MACVDDTTMISSQENGVCDVDTTYFASYEDLSVHELMLKDKPRTLAYKDFISNNAALFKDKIVMDIGAGTGILSMFAAQAGAKKVYAIEGSKLSYTCAMLVRHNDFGDVIEVVHSRVEDTELPDVKADVIISEWMGFYLFHESMLNSLIAARNKWLAPDGLMVPSSASLHLCPVEMNDYHKKFGFWDDVYGFDFSPLVPMLKHQTEPVVRTLNAKQLLAKPQLVTTLEMAFVTEDDVQAIRTHPNFTFTKNSLLHGFACWFDVDFDSDIGDNVKLSTSPAASPTHWEQTVLMLPDALLATKGETLSCHLEIVQDASQHRRYNITIQLDEADSEEEEDETDAEEEDKADAEMDFQDDIKDHLIMVLEGHGELGAGKAKD